MAFRKQIAIAMISGLAFTGMAQATPAPEYVKKAGAGDLYEKQSSQLVLTTTKDANIRRFASMMVTDHAKSTAMVKAAATRSGLSPKPPVLMPEQKDMIARLTAAKGAARDKLYVEQQKTAHQMALATQQDYASTGDKAPLKQAAAGIVPVVEHHIQMLSAM